VIVGECNDIFVLYVAIVMPEQNVPRRRKAQDRRRRQARDESVLFQVEWGGLLRILEKQV
ncbi:MAG: hypothetical protein AAGM38_12530, partial [Pseudomonadota bacterium]